MTAKIKSGAVLLIVLFSLLFVSGFAGTTVYAKSSSSSSASSVSSQSEYSQVISSSSTTAVSSSTSSKKSASKKAESVNGNFMSIIGFALVIAAAAVASLFVLMRAKLFRRVRGYSPADDLSLFKLHKK